MGRVSTCQKNCKKIDLRGVQVNARLSVPHQAIIWTNAAVLLIGPRGKK